MKNYVVETFGEDARYASLRITLTQGETEIQPTGRVTAAIEVPEGFDGEKCLVFRMEEDGSFTDMQAQYKGGYLVFETDHFSTYAVVEEPHASVDIGDINEDGAIDKKDSLRLRKYLADPDGVEINENVADVTGDGVVDKKDALRLRKYLAGWDVTLG